MKRRDAKKPPLTWADTSRDGSARLHDNCPCTSYSAVMDTERHLVAVLRGKSAARFKPEGGQLQISNMNTAAVSMDLLLYTRHLLDGGSHAY
jgi:hypothetical protein